MASKKKNNAPTQHEIHICYICGKEIHGNHVRIKPRRQGERHIHFECVPGRVNNKV